MPPQLGSMLALTLEMMPYLAMVVLPFWSSPSLTPLPMATLERSSRHRSFLPLKVVEVSAKKNESLLLAVVRQVDEGSHECMKK